MVLSPATAAFTTGCLRRFTAQAFTMNARNVGFSVALARSWATRVKSTSKKLATCAEVRRDMIIWSAVILRILDHGSTRSPGQASTLGAGSWGPGAGDTLTGPRSINPRMSCFVTLPAKPDPAIVEMSTRCSAAIFRTSGVDFLRRRSSAVSCPSPPFPAGTAGRSDGRTAGADGGGGGGDAAGARWAAATGGAAG